VGQSPHCGYGPVIHGGRSHFVDLHQVVAVEGISFSPEQLAAVGIIPQPQEAA
jgi:hypothetical protein